MNRTQKELDSTNIAPSSGIQVHDEHPESEREPCLHRPYAVLRIHDTQITITREPRRVRHRARPNPRHLVGAKLVVTQSHVKKISLLPGLSFNVLVAVAGHRANSVNHVKS